MMSRALEGVQVMDEWLTLKDETDAQEQAKTQAELEAEAQAADAAQHRQNLITSLWLLRCIMGDNNGDQN